MSTQTGSSVLPGTVPAQPSNGPAQSRTNHLTARPADDYSWRPLQRSTRAAVGLALVVTLYYVVFLLNPAYRGNPWLWGAVVAAEGLTVFQALGTWWTVLANQGHPDTTEVVLNRRRLATGAWTPTIDVFITACGEPLEIVTGTIRAARDMSVEHRTWILDDGGSDELRDACAELGVGYLRRGDSAHAKAGNVNAGLARTSGEFVVVLDADHVPSPDFLLRAVPHLADDSVAFAQTPQAFPSAKGLVAGGTAEAQRIFYELVCPGKNVSVPLTAV